MPEIQVAFEGPLGTLRGILHRPDGEGDAPGIVMLHGFTGQHIEDKRLFVQAARHLAAAGFAVLRMDFYGSGNSDGGFEEMTVLTEVEDAVVMIDWISAQPGIDAGRIGVIGLSMGGAVMALLAARDDRVKAIVFWNALSQPELHFGEYARTGPEAGIVGGMRLGDQFWTVFDALDIPGALADYSGPGLVIRGTGDDVVLASEADVLAATLGDRGTLHKIDRADHTFQHPAWRAEVFAVTTGWLKSAL